MGGDHLNKILFFEFYLAYFAELENDYDLLKQKLQKGRGVKVIAMQMYDLQVRMNEATTIFLKLKDWFD